MSEMCETMFDTRQSAPANGPLMWNVDLCLIISSSSLRTTIWAVAWSHPRSHLKFSIASVVRPLVTNHLSPWMGMSESHQPPVTMDGNVRLSPTKSIVANVLPHKQFFSLSICLTAHLSVWPWNYQSVSHLFINLLICLWRSLIICLTFILSSELFRFAHPS